MIPLHNLTTHIIQRLRARKFASPMTFLGSESFLLALNMIML
jgi:hypothetical protein